MNSIQRSAMTTLIALVCAQSIWASADKTETTQTTSDRGLGLFHDYIQPLLKNHCYQCHSHDFGEAEGGLVLDSRNGWAKGGSRGPAIVAEKPEKSLLIKAVEYDDEDLQMPPDGKLSDDDIARLRQWIKLGAPDPRVALERTSQVRTTAPRAEDLWSVQPLSAAGIPKVNNSSWPRTDIDRFILATLESSRIQPSPDAPAHTVLNRLHYVLTGLPPTPSETRLFLASMDVTRRVSEDTKEPSPTGRISLDRGKRPSYEEVLAEKVDELLDSPDFGVRWGRHWLDLARYADSPGTTDPTPYPESWRYRDYIIDAFRNDKPFDQFVREQIAGDLLPAETPSQRVTNLIATGFISLGHVLGIDRDIEKLTLDRIDEQLDVIGTSLLGIRFGCARCHDHKLDPFPTRDYYAMAGIFRSTQAGLATRMGPGLRPAGMLPILVGDFPAWMIATNKTQFHGADEAIQARDEVIHLRGAVHVHGDVVPRGFPTLISVQDVSAIPPEASGRLELTDWLLSDKNPLVARVIVNRVWHHVFGQGIVRTTDNFGFTGDPPSHPDLLDYLARRFRDEHAWSFKSLIRELVMSRTWRQASDRRQRNPKSMHESDTDSDLPRLRIGLRSAMEIDPTNRLLWRGNIRRMDAEALVDSLRFVAGALDPEPASRTVPQFDVGNQGSTNDLKIDQDILRKRAIYWPVFRKDVPVVMDVLGIFDFPNSTAPKGTRDVTHVPAQSLSLLNSPMVHDTAQSLAHEVSLLNTGDAGKLDHLYTRLFARRPTQAERDRAAKFLDSFSSELTRAKAAKPVDSRNVAWNRLCHALLVCNEFLTVE